VTKDGDMSQESGTWNVLSDAQAEAALAGFKRRGWLNDMLEEIKLVGGDTGALGNIEWAKHVLNVRFRLENIAYFDGFFASVMQRGARRDHDDPDRAA
jgi:hypothetical protein